MDPRALAAMLEGHAGPLIVCTQAGEVNTGAFDPLGRDHRGGPPHPGAWLHVDGAFGLWAAASPRLRHLIEGHDGADSWATDGHKWLNVPYDSGFAFVRDAAAHRAAMGGSAAYLPPAPEATRDPWDYVPELSRRARGFTTYAAIRELGASGIAALVERDHDLARAHGDPPRERIRAWRSSTRSCSTRCSVGVRWRCRPGQGRRGADPARGDDLARGVRRSTGDPASACRSRAGRPQSRTSTGPPTPSCAASRTPARRAGGLRADARSVRRSGDRRHAPAEQLAAEEVGCSLALACSPGTPIAPCHPRRPGTRCRRPGATGRSTGRDNRNRTRPSARSCTWRWVTVGEGFVAGNGVGTRMGASLRSRRAAFPPVTGSAIERSCHVGQARAVAWPGARPVAAPRRATPPR